jgi:flagellar biosynthesis chaperone FliJ
MVTQQQKNVKDKTKVEAIERLLSKNKKRLRAWHVLIRNHVERIFQRNTL